MNVLLIVLDTLRADHLGCYGYPRPTSPNLDALAARGVRCEWNYAASNSTIPGFTSLVTGLYPERHREVNTVPGTADRADFLPHTVPVLAELFWRAGYQTAAVDNLHSFAFRPTWFVRGYRTYVNTTLPTAPWPAAPTADQINDELLPLLRRLHEGGTRRTGAASPGKQPWFCFVHYWDVHQPYWPPEGWKAKVAGVPLRRYTAPGGSAYVEGAGRAEDFEQPWRGRDVDQQETVDRYDGQIAHVDNAVGQVIALLDELGTLDETLICVTADHGESMAEHLVRYEHRSLYDPVARVPAIWAGPGIARSRVLQGFTHHADVAPTLVDLTGIADTANRPASAPDPGTINTTSPGTTRDDPYLSSVFRMPPDLIAINETARQGMQGASLAAALRGESDWTTPARDGAGRDFVVTAQADDLAALRAIRTERWFFQKRYHDQLPHVMREGMISFHAPRELYGRQADPEHLSNLVDAEPDVAQELEATLDQWVQAHLGPGESDPLLKDDVITRTLLSRRGGAPLPAIVAPSSRSASAPSERASGRR
jgi:arylsulfatase A-like enzyme